MWSIGNTDAQTQSNTHPDLNDTQNSTKTMATDYKFEGWLGHSPESVEGKMEWGPFEPKKWAEDDVDIQVTHCGICGSDLYMLRSGWSETPYREHTQSISCSCLQSRPLRRVLVKTCWLRSLAPFPGQTSGLDLWLSYQA